jgi:hypothetical protein
LHSDKRSRAGDGEEGLGGERPAKRRKGKKERMKEKGVAPTVSAVEGEDGEYA